MKTALHLSEWVLVTLVCLLAANSASAQFTMVSDSVVVGSNLENEVYYSMADGFVSTYPRDSWDIAFRTKTLTASIIINDGTGVELYTYPKSDTSGWATMDTAGFYTWKVMYNDPASWDDGAFNRYSYGEFDYGWGIYNLSTHNLTGDSLYVIKLRDGSLRKLWIQRKESAANKYDFKYAMMNGTGEHDVVLANGPYVSRDFVGYSLETNAVVDYQPRRSSWDILFTKYIGLRPGGVLYPVLGVLSNDTTTASETFQHVSPDFNNWWEGQWDSTRSAIGSDWKVFDGTAYSIVDSLVYFVTDVNHDIYKLVFTAFDRPNGKIVFKKGKVSSLGVNGNKVSPNGLAIYPNPANDRLNISIPPVTSGMTILTLNDLSGRTIRKEEVDANTTILTWDVSALTSGIYVIQASSGSGTTVKKVVISH
jgi:hypothetical protein